MTATQTIDSMHKLAEMAETDKAGSCLAGPLVQAIYAAMLGRPNVSVGWLAEKNGVTPATVNNALVHLESLGIVQQLGENKRNRPLPIGSLWKF